MCSFPFRLIPDSILARWQSRLVSSGGEDEKFSLSFIQVKAVCHRSVGQLLREPAVVCIPPSNYIIVGDIHGQFSDLLYIFNRYGWPPNTKYVFLGDYVDRGTRALEVMTLLLILKIRFPSALYLLRGNHETAVVSHLFGFHQECRTRAGDVFWDEFLEVFDALPFAGHIPAPASILCVHGGISPYANTLAEIENAIHRPLDVTPRTSGLISDLLWADPCPDITHFCSNPRGQSVMYGLKATRKFLDNNNLKRIVRAHTYEEEGWAVMGEQAEVVTVFSAPNYKRLGGKGAVMVLKEDGSFTLEVMHE